MKVKLMLKSFLKLCFKYCISIERNNRNKEIENISNNADSYYTTDLSYENKIHLINIPLKQKKKKSILLKFVLLKNLLK